jgi:hypothetical protein
MAIKFELSLISIKSKVNLVIELDLNILKDFISLFTVKISKLGVRKCNKLWSEECI